MRLDEWCAAGPGLPEWVSPGRLKTAEGRMEYSTPQIAGRDEPFRSAIRQHLKRHTQGLEDVAIEMLARGLSVRDIEDAFQGRDWPAVVIEDRGLAAWGAAVGGLPGVHAAGLERVRDHLSVCRWDRRAFAAWRETRAGSGGLGFHP